MSSRDTMSYAEKGREDQEKKRRKPNDVMSRMKDEFT